MASLHSLTSTSWYIVVLLGLAGCGEMDPDAEGFDPAFLLDPASLLDPDSGEEQALTVDGHVLDAHGRPLFDVGVWLEPEEPGTTNAELAVMDFTGPDGSYHLEVPRPGRYQLRFTADQRDDADTLAVVDLDLRASRELDVTIDRADVASCRLIGEDGAPQEISSWSLTLHRERALYGTGGFCGGSVPGCGATALTFFWPSGHSLVQLDLGSGTPIELTGPGEVCDIPARDR